MALYPFLEALKTAREAFFGRTNEMVNAGRRADTSILPDAVKRTTDVWLTPELVKEFDEADFDFLSPEKRTELNRAVGEFRRLTDGLRGGSPSDVQILQGYDLLVQINNLLEPHPEEPDYHRIVRATESVPWPDYVLGVNFRLGLDSTGDPAVWIWLVVEDDVEIESPSIQAQLARVREAYRNAIQQAGINRWPYITVRTRSEVKELLGSGAT